MSLSPIGQTGPRTIPSGILCSFPWRGQCGSQGLTREHEVIMGEANLVGKVKGPEGVL